MAEPARELPIIMTGESIPAIFEGRKGQTRRLRGLRKINEEPDAWTVEVDDGGAYFTHHHGPTIAIRCPYGQSGDRLWVRETHAIVPASAYRCSREPDGSPVAHRVDPSGTWWALYREGWTRVSPSRWRPSIFMPKWVCRLRLPVTSVRVERLQDITEADIIAEGFATTLREHDACVGLCEGFAAGWDSINAKRAPWSSNPWVWVISFERVEEGDGG
jgi:hypothetical protein